MAQTQCGFPSQQHLALYGPTLSVNIGFDPNWKPATPPAGNTTPVAGITDVKALVDTGATECCIDNLLAASLKLPIVDRRRIAGISGEHIANVYLAQVHVPALDYTMYGAFAGVDLAAGGQAHSALMGRTFLRAFRMTYDGPSGGVTIST